MREYRKLTREEVLWFEIQSTWWVKYVNWPWAHALAGSYFARKVNRKYKHYEKSLEERKRVIGHYGPNVFDDLIVCNSPIP